MMKKSINVVICIAIGGALLVLGCAKKKDIFIGGMFALTGDYAPWGERAKRGAEIALEEINKETTKGSKIRIIYEDSPGEPQKAVSAFRKLVDLDKVKFILGPLSSAEALAIAPIAEKKKIIILTPVASAPQLTHAGDYIFRNCLSDISEGSASAEFVIRNLRKKGAAILYLNNDFGLGLKESFSKRFNYLGGHVITEEAFNAGDKDFRTQLSKVKFKNPKVVILAGYAVEMGLILKQAMELRIKSQFISFSSFESPEILKIAGEATTGVYYIYQGFDGKSEEDVVKQFAEHYKMKYKEEPDIFAALSYDAMKIFAEAFRRSDPDNVESVKTALYGIKNFIGVTGKTSFDKNGDVTKPIGIKKVENGKFIWVEKKFEVDSGEE